MSWQKLFSFCFFFKIFVCYNDKRKTELERGRICQLDKIMFLGHTNSRKPYHTKNHVEKTDTLIYALGGLGEVGKKHVLFMNTRMKYAS